ncbi:MULTISPECIES: DNA adenine methylase [Methylosinus]|uniref:DNA adenine methylase n=1 Tax=Methylosinus TaxID=425 RepID=UPI001FCB1ABA|nr:MULTISPECIES: DNA adenine methylase [Methylosinus]
MKCLESRAGEMTRPLVRWHGGKWLLAPWIISNFPQHRSYVEPFGGGGSVLLRKPRCYAEVYNDLDGRVVNLFRVLRDEAKAARLVRALELTPFAREEFVACHSRDGDDVELARRMLVICFQGFGSNAHGRATGFRANSKRSATTPAGDWRNYPDALPAIIERLRGVVVENRPALDVMAQHDSPDTLFYLDPPYLPSVRDRGRDYEHEMSIEDHSEMLRAVQSLCGMVVLSGYASALYDHSLAGWSRVERRAFADGARERVEVLWLNPAATHALPEPSLFLRGTR